jgi:hypothetical protein
MPNDTPDSRSEAIQQGLPDAPSRAPLRNYVPYILDSWRADRSSGIGSIGSTDAGPARASDHGLRCGEVLADPERDDRYDPERDG